MSYLSNLHTHTDFCDGADSAEAMVKRAVSMGYKSLGFSGHSYAPFDVPNCMTEQGTGEYVSEILRLREKYRDKIQIYLGVEEDAFGSGRFAGVNVSHDADIAYAIE